MNKLKILDSSLAKFTGLIILTLLLIFVSIILFEDVGLDNSMLIYNIFGTLTLVSFLYSFHTTSKKLYNELSLGITRKEFYKNYLKNISIVLLVSIFFVIYYMIIYKLIIGTNNSLSTSFDIKKVIYLPMTFLTLSFFGFFLGIMKMRRSFFYTLVVIITTIVVLIVTYISIKQLYNILLGLIVISLGVLDYILVKNVDV